MPTARVRSVPCRWRFQSAGARSPRGHPVARDGSPAGAGAGSEHRSTIGEPSAPVGRSTQARAEDRGGPDPSRFHSPLHSEWLAAVLGIMLGVSFTVCFLTGMVDYLAQHPPYWFHLPVRPVNLFRVTEGIHVLTGIVAIPLLLAKLWVVYPNFFAYPPVRSAAHALERISLVPLVGGALFELGYRGRQHRLLVQPYAVQLHHGPFLRCMDHYRRPDRPHRGETVADPGSGLGTSHRGDQGVSFRAPM